MKGNKGEWSELYVFFQLLADGKLYAADENMNKNINNCIAIDSIIRDEARNQHAEYKVRDDVKTVEIYVNGDRVTSIPRSVLSAYAKDCYYGIVSGQGRTFEIIKAENAMQKLQCNQIKAASEDKADIHLNVRDAQSAVPRLVGYSIKSYIGGSPTLLNASGATKIRYPVTGLSSIDVTKINAIKSHTLLHDRITEIMKCGTISAGEISDDTFAGNLLMVDSLIGAIIAQMLLCSYVKSERSCSELITMLENEDPLGLHRANCYRFKFKKLLSAVALGMQPKTEWCGQDEASGGYIIAKEDGEILAYHLYNRDTFETYLLNNTILETPSTSKYPTKINGINYNLGSLYPWNGNWAFDLGLQIRFK